MEELLRLMREYEQRLDRLETTAEQPVFVPWTDYSSTSTVTGWTSFTTKYIAYKKVGKSVFVQFFLDGTSNATTVSFTLPYSNGAGAAVQVIARVRDNGTWAAGLATLAATASTVNGFTTPAGAAWTNSGTKSLIGELWFEVA